MADIRVRTNDFIASSQDYAKATVSKANKDKNRYLTKAEALSLPRDLRANFEAHRKGAQKNGSALTAKFVERYGNYVAVHARRADANKDGDIDGRELSRLPRDLRDNARNFHFATSTLHRVGTLVSSSPAVLLNRLERGIARHDWQGLLPLFAAENRQGQHEMGINDFQYIAEGLGLHMQNNRLPGPVSRRATLDLIQSVSINRTAAEVADTYQRFTGTATLKSGKTLNVDLFMSPVKGGWVFEPPVG